MVSRGSESAGWGLGGLALGSRQGDAWRGQAESRRNMAESRYPLSSGVGRCQVWT